jgi:hypothetical protein
MIHNREPGTTGSNVSMAQRFPVFKTGLPGSKPLVGTSQSTSAKNSSPRHRKLKPSHRSTDQQYRKFCQRGNLSPSRELSPADAPTAKEPLVFSFRCILTHGKWMFVMRRVRNRSRLPALNIRELDHQNHPQNR